MDYIYSETSDFTNGVDSSQLHKTIDDYKFSSTFVGIIQEGDLVKVMFNENLSVEDLEVLNKIISSHTIRTSPYNKYDGISYLYEASDERESSTISMTWQTKLKLSIDDLKIGRYRVSWSAEAKPYSYNTGLFGGRVHVDEKTILSDVKFGEIFAYNYNSWAPWSGFSYVDLDQTSHVFTLEYCALQSARTVRIRRANLELWRVS